MKDDLLDTRPALAFIASVLLDPPTDRRRLIEHIRSYDHWMTDQVADYVEAATPTVETEPRDYWEAHKRGQDR